ncbi:hypothetical protein BJ166DRAFT_629267 [Pestalotiopsis sp. NC0098]|nr:hypothetical protein BJ166DRAFT_629267 [Pestalotiopsis sp. NC0098]
MHIGRFAGSKVQTHETKHTWRIRSLAHNLCDSKDPRQTSTRTRQLLLYKSFLGMPTIIGKILSLVGIKQRSKMTNEPFQANNTVKHRYEKTDILEKTLKELEFDPKTWRINDKNRPGIQIMLPRKLTQEEVEKIYAAYEAAKEAEDED